VHVTLVKGAVVILMFYAVVVGILYWLNRSHRAATSSPNEVSIPLARLKQQANTLKAFFGKVSAMSEMATHQAPLR
jgi:hypothetical protein